MPPDANHRSGTPESVRHSPPQRAEGPVLRKRRSARGRPRNSVSALGGDQLRNFGRNAGRRCDRSDHRGAYPKSAAHSESPIESDGGSANFALTAVASSITDFVKESKSTGPNVTPPAAPSSSTMSASGCVTSSKGTTEPAAASRRNTRSLVIGYAHLQRPASRHGTASYSAPWRHLGFFGLGGRSTVFQDWVGPHGSRNPLGATKSTFLSFALLINVESRQGLTVKSDSSVRNQSSVVAPATGSGKTSISGNFLRNASVSTSLQCGLSSPPVGDRVPMKMGRCATRRSLAR